jgi:hypothetical protein
MIVDDSDLIGHETGAIGKVISLAFRAYVERPKQRSYAIWMSIWIWGGPGLQVGLELGNSELDWFANFSCTSPWIANTFLMLHGPLLDS